MLQIPALGGLERRLASCADAEGLDWSPSGDRLVWAERPSPGEPFRIVELGFDDLKRREITQPPAGSVGDLGPVVSPDGTRLAFLRSPVLGVEDIYIQSLAGGEPRRLTSDSLKIHGADWMPDGRSLIFSSNRGGLFSLWQASLAGGKVSWLGVSGGDLDAPSVGSAGKRIAYEHWSDDTNLYRMSLSGGAEAYRLLGSTRWDWAPHVPPNGEEVVFVSDRTGSSELWAQSVDGRGAARQLTEFGGPYLNHPRWNPEGTEIAFDARPDGNADIYLLRDGELRPRRLTTSPAQDLAPTWSRDGRRLYFGSDRSGTWQIWSVSPGGDEPSQVTEHGGYFAQESPDGRWLYFTRRDEPGLWRQPIAAPGPVEHLIQDLAPMDGSHWLVKGDSLLYLRRHRHDQPVLTRFHPATGRVAELAELGSISHNSGLALGPGGDSVLFTRRDRWESDILLLETGS